MPAPRPFPRWLFPHLIALDAPLVAVVWQRLLAAAFGVAVPVAAAVGLAAVVWAIYLLDRVLDARNPDHQDTDRHHFAHRHPRSLVALAVVALVVGGGTAFLLPWPYVWAGLAVAAAVAGYVAVVHRLLKGSMPRGAKELLVGVVFAAGVSVPLIAEADARKWLPAVIAFGMVCCLNCRLIDRWETNRQTGRWTGRAIGLTAVVVGWWSPLAVWLALASAVIALFLLDLFHARLGLRLSRVLADVTLLTPLVIWPLV